jgi:hypothetical protein
MAKHSINLGHHIQCHNTSILAKKSGCMEHLITDVKDIELHPVNRGECFSLSRSQMPQRASYLNPEGMKEGPL